jgi:hypothetical protein
MRTSPRAANAALPALLLAFSLALSCVGAGKPPAPEALPAPDPIAIGASAFSAGKLLDAEREWSMIPDSRERELYTAFARAYAAFDASARAAESALADRDPAAALEAIAGAAEPPPAPAAVAEPDPLAVRARADRAAAAAAAALASAAVDLERDADASIAAARRGPKAALAGALDAAAEGYDRAAGLFMAAAERGGSAERGANRAGAKGEAARALGVKLLKESLLSFPERMGEIFARAPVADGRLGDKDILAFNIETDALLREGLSEFDGIVASHPGLLDEPTLDRLRGSVRSLSSRFSRAEAALRLVKDRGKPVMPFVIGIFNPQPGDPLRSRPARFAGMVAGGGQGGSDWWWGVADIPKGSAQDLVVTMSDSRPVRVYATRSGVKPSADLINPLFRVGNSWPILNAGARLAEGVFHIEVGPGKARQYSGEAAVYKSFVTRTR